MAEPDTPSFQIPIALISLGPRLATMSGTIEFNNQFQGQAAEIHNRIAQGELAAKLIAKQRAIAEKLPGRIFRQGIGVTEFSSTRG
jgi:hypothetical protein